MNVLEKKWYVIKTVSGNENKVKNYIEKEIRHLGFDNNIGQILVPVEKVIQIRNGKKIHREKVYYPGYVMLEAFLEGEIIHVVKNIPGVINFLSEQKGGQPVPMRKSEISKMLGKVDELSETDAGLSIPFTIGEKVKVTDGPFSGFDGTVEKINEEKRKISLTVLIFGRKTPLDLNFAQIERIA